jgi:hypothetical protein
VKAILAAVAIGAALFNLQTGLGVGLSSAARCAFQQVFFVCFVSFVRFVVDRQLRSR